MSLEPYHFSQVHVLFEKMLVFGGQMWKHSQLGVVSKEKETRSRTIKLWFKQRHYTTPSIVSPNKHCHYKFNDILETSTLASLVFYLFWITLFIHLSRALHDHSPDCSDSCGDDLCCHSNIMFPIIVLCLKNIRTHGARQGVITLTACSYKSIYSLGGKKKMKKKKLIRLQKKIAKPVQGYHYQQFNRWG